MKQLSFLLVALAFILALVPTEIAQAENPLTGTIDYDFVGHLGEFDDDGRLLVWVGTISGDINGVIRWWAVLGTPDTGQVHHFVERWEIWNVDETVLLLAGDDRGTTTIRHEKNSNWRTNGIVTEASGEFENWIGRHVHAGGHFTWQVIETPGGPITIPDTGSGIFRIN